MAQNNNNKNKQKAIMDGYSSPQMYKISTEGLTPPIMPQKPMVSPQTPHITTNQPTESQKQNAEKKN
ncbi:hypothetical protein [Helicobacter sp. UBA3407]|uniref:hypothetical protein n=1 Tax=Helicobacter sp. UBA3407 TaxID=1946588 RepID=UPI002602ABA8|nr:hypothetical protein [Helicobacter sp. UBA3407]